ncbi:MAG: hypothetical protein AAGI30_07485 [Planctomycetota bacterium]
MLPSRLPVSLAAALTAITALPLLALGGCSSSEPAGPPAHVGNWIQDGAVRRGSAYLQLAENGTFIFQRVMAERVPGPTHRGQWRLDEKTGRINLFKYLKSGGVSHAPLISFQYDWPYIRPIDMDTGEPNGRHLVRRDTLPAFVLEGENVPDTVLAAAAAGD